MKWIILVFCSIMCNSCVMIGTNMIHSPSSSEGKPVKHRYVHGGATKNSPPDAILFQVDDSIDIFIKARKIWEKKLFGGIVIPICPLFWLPIINYYEEQPNSLIITLSNWNNEYSLEINSAILVAKGKFYKPRDIKSAGSTTMLIFPLAAEETTTFKLINLSLSVNGEQKIFPEITFEKMKQTWLFMGP